MPHSLADMDEYNDTRIETEAHDDEWKFWLLVAVCVVIVFGIVAACGIGMINVLRTGLTFY